MTLQQLKEQINSLANREVYAKIYRQWFERSPRRVLRLPLKKYGLNSKKVLDFGSAFGSSLIHFGEGSIGIELNREYILFAQDVGLPIFPINIFSEEFDSKIANNEFDAIWCCAVLEHMDSPHSALINLRRKLQDGGLIFVTVPIIPKYNFAETILKKIIKFTYGHSELSYTSSDHVNAFSKKTIEFMVMRAGFEVIETNIFFASDMRLNALINLIFNENWDMVTVVGRKIANYQYHEKASRTINESQIVVNKLLD